jgi:hypothetical protein
MSFTDTLAAKAPDVRSASGHLTLRVARSIAEVEELRDTWEAWQEHPDSVIDSYLTWFKKDPSARPHVMAVYRDAAPDCLLVGKRLHGVPTSAVDRILGPLPRLLYFVKGGLLGNPSPENCDFLVRRIIAQLRRGEADAAELFGLPVDSPLYRAAIQVPNFFCRDHFPVKVVHRYLLLPESLQDFLRALPAKERQNIAYREKRLLKNFPGKVRLRRFAGEHDLQCLINDAEEVAAKAYQRALGRGFTLIEGQGLFAQARAGSLRGYVLYVEEKPCAFLIARWHKEILYGTFAGHDPSYSEYSPGRYLLMRCIEDCFLHNGREKTVILDPGHGDQPYKRLFTNAARQDACLAIYAPTFKGALRNFAKTALLFAELCAKRLLLKLHLFTRVQKNRRNRALRKAAE